MPADLILTNGSVQTAEEGGRVAEAVAVTGSRITAVGAAGEVMALRGAGTTVIDLRGRTVLPGLIDAHCHLLGLGLARRAIDLNYPKARSVAGICLLVEERTRLFSPGAWIRGRGYDQLRLEERRHPTRWDLDPVSHGHPVLLTQSSGHAGVANSEALRLAGIGAETPDPPGGIIERSQGQPTGLLKEAALGLVEKVAAPSREERESALRAAAREYLGLGVTTVCDMSGSVADETSVIQDLAGQGGLGLRVVLSHIPHPPSSDRSATGEGALETGFHTGIGDRWVRLGPFKFMLDGSDDTATAAMHEPYPGTGTTGISLWADGDLSDLATKAAALGWQLSAHAIGDRAIDQAISAFGAAGRGAGSPGTRRRDRVEHCIYPTAEAVASIIESRLVPVVQPIFISMVDEGYRRLFTPGTLARGFPIRTFIGAGLPVAAGSDAPVADPNPLVGMASAIDRRTHSGDPFRLEEAVTWDQALAMYTRHAAWSAFLERELGTIAPGNLADLVVLGAGVDCRSAEDLRAAPVDLTISDGQVRHGRG